MSKFIATSISAIAFVALTGTAQAKDKSFNVSFEYDNKAPVSQTYKSFEKSAETACRGEIRRAGFRATDSTSWELRKCKAELIAQAVKSTRNTKLIAFHHHTVNPSTKTTKLASAK